jgi:hypothetical protein
LLLIKILEMKSMTIERTNDWEWDGVHEQMEAERVAGWDDGYSDYWLQQWGGLFEDATLQQAADCVTQPVHELLPFWDSEQRCFVWAIREIDPLSGFA